MSAWSRESLHCIGIELYVFMFNVGIGIGVKLSIWLDLWWVMNDDDKYCIIRKKFSKECISSMRSLQIGMKWKKNVFLKRTRIDSKKKKKRKKYEMNFENKHYGNCSWRITFGSVGAGFVAHWWERLRNIGHRSVCGLRIFTIGLCLFAKKLMVWVCLYDSEAVDRQFFSSCYFITLRAARTIVDAHHNEQITF